MSGIPDFPFVENSGFFLGLAIKHIGTVGLPHGSHRWLYKLLCEPCGKPTVPMWLKTLLIGLLHMGIPPVFHLFSFEVHDRQDNQRDEGCKTQTVNNSP